MTLAGIRNDDLEIIILTEDLFDSAIIPPLLPNGTLLRIVFIVAQILGS